MNSKERVIASLERRWVDRVPLSLEARPGAIEKLYRHFKVRNIEDLRSKMNIDIRGIGPSYVGVPSRPSWEGFSASDGENRPTEFGGTDWMPCNYSEEEDVAATYSDDLGFRPLQNVSTIREVDDYAWPRVEWWKFDNIKEECQRYRGYAIIVGGWTPILSRLFELFGIKKTFVNLCVRPDLMRSVVKKMMDYYYELYDTALSSAEGGIDIVGFGDDFATQDNLMISPEMWRSLFKQALSRLFSLGEKHGAYVYFHACGAVRSIIPDLIETGLDILYPVQPRARGMNHTELKEEFGDHLAFWGGVDVQKTLPFGTMDEVRREVRERINVLGAGGGYILSSSHNLLKHFPLRNILAMYDEAVKTAPRG